MERVGARWVRSRRAHSMTLAPETGSGKRPMCGRAVAVSHVYQHYTDSYAKYSGCPALFGGRVCRRYRIEGEAWVCGFERGEDSLREPGQGAAGGHDSRVSGLLVHVARPDGSAVGQISVRRDGSARLQPERQAQG